MNSRQVGTLGHSGKVRCKPLIQLFEKCDVRHTRPQRVKRMRERQAMSNGLRTIVPRERNYALAPNGVGKGRRYRGGVRTMLIPLLEHERAQSLAGHCLHATRGIVKCHTVFANDLLRKKFDYDGAINRRAEIDAGFGRRPIGVGDGERFTVGQRRPITDACASTVAQNETAARLLARQRHAVGVGEGH